MAITVGKLTAQMAAWADPVWAEDYDNVGLLIGRKDREVDTVVTCLDVTEDVIDYAEEVGAQMIISHHPVIFRAFKRITDETRDGRRLLKLIENGLAVAAAHTNLDAAPGGTNDILSEKLGMLQVTPIESIDEEGTAGMGRIGYLPQACTARELAEHVKQVLGLSSVRLISRDPDTFVHRIALCTGTGMSFFEKACSLGADVFLTGDVTYHQAEAAAAEGFCVIDAGHFGTEIAIAEAMAQVLQQENEGLTVYAYQNASDPYLTV